MKKLFLTMVALATFGWANAQEGLKVGAQVGLPLGDFGKAYSLNAGANVSYLVALPVENLYVGGTAGFGTFFGKDVNGVKIDNYNYIPVAATAHYTIVENLFVATDLGYAISVTKDSDGGFLYHPKIGYQALTFEVYAGFMGFSIGNESKLNANTITIGANFRL